MSASARFMDSMILTGSFRAEATERKWLLVTAISRDAGTPLPDTSPMAKNRWPSLMKKSYRSPPISLAG